MTDTYQYRHDWEESEPLSTTVLTAVGAVTNTPPAAQEPLYNVIDPDALDELFTPGHNAMLRDGAGSVSFAYEGCDVTVYWTGDITIQVLHETPPRSEADLSGK